MRASILSIGSELMLGQITDTNASWLARDLAEIGIDLVQVTQVGDDRTLLLRALKLALEVGDVIICTGGIGPTDDDLTRETIAELVGETPEVDPELHDTLLRYFADVGRVMPPRNAKQAWLIPSAEAVSNPVGTAPGWFVTVPGTDKFICTMPGVPREMYRMWMEQMRPRLLAKTDAHIIDTLQLKTIGIGESDAEERIHDLILAGEPQIATYAKDDGVHIRITAVGNDPAEVRTRRDRAEKAVREHLGDFIWGVDNDTLAGVIARELTERHLRISITEIGTGGAFSALLASDEDAAQVFIRDLVLPMGASLPEFDSDPATIDVLASLTTERDDDGVHRGNLIVKFYHERLLEPIEQTWQVRGSMPDVQRRVGINIVYALHQWLMALQDEPC